MTRISNSEAVLAAVRAQLQRMAKRDKAGAASKAGAAHKADVKSMTSRQMVDALAAIEGLSEEDFTRGFVRALLTEEFGEKLANSAEFQNVVDRTSAALREDGEVRAMLAQVRSGAG
jgi:hypothetical protein